MFVHNPTAEKCSVTIFGNWFSMNPGQTKRLRDEFCDHIQKQLGYTGLVVLSDKYDEPEYKESPEGKEEFEALCQNGIKCYVEYHKRIVANNQVSLRQDLDRANLKVDPIIYASEGERESLRIVAKYQKAASDAEHTKVDEMKKLLKEIGTK